MRCHGDNCILMDMQQADRPAHSPQVAFPKTSKLLAHPHVPAAVVLSQFAVQPVLVELWVGTAAWHRPDLQNWGEGKPLQADAIPSSQ